MSVTVVDASALAAITFDEPGADTVSARLKGASLVAPMLLTYEMLNVCVTKLRIDPEMRGPILQAFAFQAGLTIERAEVGPPGVVALAVQYGLSGYDASYLWLAHHLDAELVTLDRRLARAAEQLRQAARKPPST